MSKKMEAGSTHDHDCQGPVVLWGCKDVLANCRANERATSSILAPIQKSLDCLTAAKYVFVCPGESTNAQECRGEPSRVSVTALRREDGYFDTAGTGSVS